MDDTLPPSDLPPPFVPFEVAGVGTCTGYDGDTYLVQVPSGHTHGYRSPSGTPSPELAAAEIAFAIANPPAWPNPVPATVTQRQLRLTLLGFGVTDGAVRAQLAGNDAALIEWEYATEIKRTHPLVAVLGAALGLNSAQIDDAFRDAAAL